MSVRKALPSSKVEAICGTFLHHFSHLVLMSKFQTPEGSWNNVTHIKQTIINCLCGTSFHVWRIYRVFMGIEFLWVFKMIQSLLRLGIFILYQHQIKSKPLESLQMFWLSLLYTFRKEYSHYIEERIFGIW